MASAGALPGPCRRLGRGLVRWSGLEGVVAPTTGRDSLGDARAYHRRCRVRCPSIGTLCCLEARVEAGIASATFSESCPPWPWTEASLSLARCSPWSGSPTLDAEEGKPKVGERPGGGATLHHHVILFPHSQLRTASLDGSRESAMSLMSDRKHASSHVLQTRGWRQVLNGLKVQILISQASQRSCWAAAVPILDNPRRSVHSLDANRRSSTSPSAAFPYSPSTPGLPNRPMRPSYSPYI